MRPLLWRVWRQSRRTSPGPPEGGHYLLFARQQQRAGAGCVHRIKQGDLPAARGFDVGADEVADEQRERATHQERARAQQAERVRPLCAGGERHDDRKPEHEDRDDERGGVDGGAEGRAELADPGDLVDERGDPGEEEQKKEHEARV
jgi:hypothetical protein